MTKQQLLISLLFFALPGCIGGVGRMAFDSAPENKDTTIPTEDVTVQTIDMRFVPDRIPTTDSFPPVTDITISPREDLEEDLQEDLVLAQEARYIPLDTADLLPDQPIPPVCPVAVIECEQGQEVIPQTVLNLNGENSYSSQGTIEEWHWKVIQPSGAKSIFVPSDQFANPTFETNVMGIYTFQLTVVDSSGASSCSPAEYEVVVLCDVALHIELLWSTPEDPDETDTGPEAGSDLDLHFTHPWASGPDLDQSGEPDGWFDIPFDCFWFNAHPNWGSYDPQISDDPSLDRDDTDGAGPENINMTFPEEVDYRLGVHYWNDHGFGASYATVRVYVYSNLVFEMSDIMLVNMDFWEVGNLHWPEGTVTPILDAAGTPYIIPQYENPYFFQ